MAKFDVTAINRKILIFGAGRMGLSHAAMAGLLDPAADIMLAEPNLKPRLLLSMIVGKKISLKRVFGAADIQTASHAVVASPPKFHAANVQYLHDCGFRGRVLIEKPVLVDAELLGGFDFVTSGYVLTQAYFWRRLRSELKSQEVKTLAIKLETNQNFRQISEGWRAQTSQSGEVLLQEFGSHCVNLAAQLTNAEELNVIYAKDNRIQIENAYSPAISIELIGGSDRVRKSVYTVEVHTSSHYFKTDFYSFSALDKSRSGKEESYTLASEGVHGAAYLRGEEFARQMSSFLDETNQESNMQSALRADRALRRLADQLK